MTGVQAGNSGPCGGGTTRMCDAMSARCSPKSFQEPVGTLPAPVAICMSGPLACRHIALPFYPSYRHVHIARRKNSTHRARDVTCSFAQ